MEKTFKSLSIKCTNSLCRGETVIDEQNLDPYFLKYFNHKYFSFIYERLFCKKCRTRNPTVAYEGKILVNGLDIKKCFRGNHPITEAQLEVTPQRTVCVACADGHEINTENLQTKVPKFRIQKPCPNCKKASKKDPKRNGYLTVRIANDTGEPYVACIHFISYYSGKCRFTNNISDYEQFLENTDEFEPLVREPLADITSNNLNEREEKFKNLSRKRITKINQAIESLGRLSQKSNYSYSEDQITKLFDEIYDSLALTKSKFGIENVRLVSHEENTKKIELESLKDKAEKLIKEIESLKDR